MAKLLSDKGIPAHPTTIAKIEAGDRSVQIDEAGAIAELFEVSLDSLLGRNVGLENDLAYTLRAVQSTARHSQNQISGITTALGERCSDLAALQFAGCDTLQSQLLAASEALLQATATLRNVLAFELPADEAVTVAQHLVHKEAREMVERQANGVSDAAT
jgi:transcriptional regulator with XRE-family HTH domain